MTKRLVRLPNSWPAPAIVTRCPHAYSIIRNGSHKSLSVPADLASPASPCAIACQQSVCAAAAAAVKLSAHIISVPGMASQNATHAAGSPAKHGTARQTSVADTHAVTQRLQSELMSLMSNADPGVSAFPAGDSLFSWLGTVKVGFTMSYAARTPTLSAPHRAALAVGALCICYMKHQSCTNPMSPALFIVLPKVCTCCMQMTHSPTASCCW